MSSVHVLLYSFLLLLINPSSILQEVHCLVCTELETETLSSLYKVLSIPTRTALLCPFTIQGDGCDENVPLIIDSGLIGKSKTKNVECDLNFKMGGQCRINCSIDAHFIVKDGKELILDSIILEGAKEASVRVMMGSILRSYSSIWRNNENLAHDGIYSGGGAIHASARAFVFLVNCEFWDNSAVSEGGALYSDGGSIIYSIASTYVANEATYGAAIYAASTRVVSHRSVFASNRASFGSVIYLDTFAEYLRLRQETVDLACDNLDGAALNGGCNGIYDEAKGICEQFQICDSPTAAPSLSPSVSILPTINPSNTPSSVPSLSSVPSITPTVDPSTPPSAQPSEIPTIFPSVYPSSVPTQLASQLPSTNPTISPSVLPSLNPSPLPSLRPTTKPSEVASAGPSQSPTSSHSKSPTMYPSVGPSLKPTISRSEIPSGYFVSPSRHPIRDPSSFPSEAPSEGHSQVPSQLPSKTPSQKPSIRRPQSRAPSALPLSTSTSIPSSRHSINPSRNASTISGSPSVQAKEMPSKVPSI
eukprot:CAMPEP_0203667986 /NCGR_PEP_ID=MMETSP0090-20130426/4707_1 /ASSEMBLY_ACC=CAM_ASM_001088 /TAXON_ID=426623 /ORGANISM="Chaetoceros affinis, Strain CCMP159" /LENGTH=531 /DNA_ID=CAMNT_0050532297 /DNA_START=221 /DNA_END=1816 /DNA_ORIENTATION=-